MRLALVQFNPTVGDVAGNAARMLEAVSRAEAAGAELVVFPELSLVGYPPRDLLWRTELHRAVEKVLAEKFAPASRNVGILLGAPVREKNYLYNTALLLYGGALFGRQDKTLLPSYDVFDETRYFKPAARRQAVLFRGETLGLTVCEDVWNDKDFWSQRLYEEDPVEELVAQGATILINIAASPYHYGKRRLRAEMLAHTAREHGRPLIYVNQVGGNDELIFDGSSLVFNGRGELVWEGEAFAEEFAIVETTSFPAGREPARVEEDISCVHAALVLGTRDYFRKTGFKRAVVGLSGGIDSSVVAALAAEALGPENVLGVGMPSPYSSPGSLRDAEALARNLGIGWRVVPIERIFAAYLETLNPDAKPCLDVAEENVQARIRGNILMFISNREGYLVLSTGNKSELAVGYCTLYGDMSGGLSVIADVPKMMVYDLARYINREREIIPAAVLTKPPSAELRPDQRDEDSLPPYRLLDPVLKAYIEENLSAEEIIARGFTPELVREVIRRVDRAEFKRRQAAPGLKVTTKAFGMGRRLPVAWRPGW
ncbi:MAG: NAD+ synthase [Bacillota bacterium]